MHSHSRRVLFMYDVLSTHPISPHALMVSLLPGASGLPTPMGTPMSTSMGTSACTPHDETTSRSKIGPVQSIGSQRSTKAGLDCWPHLKILPGHGPRSHRPWDPRAGQLSRWASRSCISLPSQASSLYIRWAVSCRSQVCHSQVNQFDLLDLSKHFLFVSAAYHTEASTRPPLSLSSVIILSFLTSAWLCSCLHDMYMAS